jgi:gluconolactonase
VAKTCNRFCPDAAYESEGIGAMTKSFVAICSRTRGFGPSLLLLGLVAGCGSSASTGNGSVRQNVAGHSAVAGTLGSTGVVAGQAASGVAGVGLPPVSGVAGVGSAGVGVLGGAGMASAAGRAGSAVPAAGSGGTGAAGTGAAGTGAAGTGSPMTYPMLDASAIGKPSQVAMGFTLAESPVWDHCGKQLLFVDVEASTIHTLSTDGKVGVFAKNTNYANGIAFDLDGSLLLAQMGGSNGHGALARRDAAGMVTVLADKDPAGMPLHTVDDVVVGSDGAIYFSDGDFAHGSTYTSLGYNAQLPVYALKPGTGMRTLLKGDTVSGPNGIELSPDEKTMYVDGFGEGTVWKFTIGADGTPKKGAALTRGLSNPDSLCLDAAGNLYVGVSSGLQVLRPDGTKVTVIPVTSAKGVTNCSFGGDNGTTLYVTAWTGVWKVDNMPIPGLDWVVNKTRQKCM